MHRYGWLLLVVVAAAILALVVLHGSGRNAPVVRARPELTPGALNPDVTQATIATTICVSGWSQSIRPPSDYTSALKLRQMAAYGESGSPHAYEEDHFISLELGGAPIDPRNLWPEPQPRAGEVDKIENQLNADVCSGRLTLAEGQRREAELKYRDG